jgi:hypothetical protein
MRIYSSSGKRRRHLTSRIRCSPLRQLGVLTNCLDETSAVAGQLRLADTADSRKVVKRGRALLGHLAKGRVVKDHVGRQPLFVGELLAQRA